MKAILYPNQLGTCFTFTITIISVFKLYTYVNVNQQKKKSAKSEPCLWVSCDKFVCNIFINASGYHLGYHVVKNVTVTMTTIASLKNKERNKMEQFKLHQHKKYLSVFWMNVTRKKNLIGKPIINKHLHLLDSVTVRWKVTWWVQLKNEEITKKKLIFILL